jgi:transposase
MRGFDLVSASAFLAEMGDLSRFATARELMGYLGLVPGEQSTGAVTAIARELSGFIWAVEPALHPAVTG